MRKRRSTTSSAARFSATKRTDFPAAADAAPRGGKAPSRQWKRKAREKVLPPWKSLKAILDKHLPESLAAEWRRKADVEWAARAQRLTDGSGDGRDCALAKILLMVYARFAGCDAQDDSLRHIEDRLGGDADGAGEEGFAPATREAFFQEAMRCLDRLDALAENWAQERTANALWGAAGQDGEFRKFLVDGSYATPAQMLRLAFLTAPTETADQTRRLRALLNVLDDSGDIDGRFFGKALSAGLDFLAGKLDLHGLEARQAGYSPAQLEDEMRKWPLDAKRVVEFEKDDLVHCGSLRFVGWSAFADEADVAARLGRIRNAIADDWNGFFCRILARLERGKEGELKYRMAIPHGNPRSWGRDVLSDGQVVRAIADMAAGKPEPAWPPWLRHFQQLARGKNLGAYHGLRSFEGWVFVLSEGVRSPDAIRLDYNENERANRKLLDGEIIHYGDREHRYALRAAKRPGFGYDVWDVSWYETTNPVAKPLATESAKSMVEKAP